MPLKHLKNTLALEKEGNMHPNSVFSFDGH